MRGLPWTPSPQARITSDDVRRMFEAAGCDVERAARPWRRNGRRFVQARLHIADVRKAASCGVLASSNYGFEVSPEQIRYTQTVGAPPGNGSSHSSARNRLERQRTGNFKLHCRAGSRIRNARRLEDGNRARWNAATS